MENGHAQRATGQTGTGPTANHRGQLQFLIGHPTDFRMNLLLLIVLSMSLGGTALVRAVQSTPQASAAPAATKTLSIPEDQENARQARALLDQAIQALGGQAYLNIHTMEQEGRTYSFYHGRPTSNGVLFWRFVEYPDKERTEVTKQRDVAYLYVGQRGYEITYKGPAPVEKKDLDDYLRRRRLSLETILRVWVKDPTVALFYDGNALAGNMPAQQVTLINSKDEAIKLYLDVDTHLPIKKSHTWRDPVDRDRDVEEEIYDNYRLVQGVMTPYGFTRYYNGDMQTQRFVSAVHYDDPIDPAMFDANSSYDPNKVVKKH